jgi:hypothetical protein
MLRTTRVWHGPDLLKKALGARGAATLNAREQSVPELSF